jgi:hypothetical protein
VIVERSRNLSLVTDTALVTALLAAAVVLQRARWGRSLHALLRPGDGDVIPVLVAAQLLVFNLAGAWLYRKAGFAAALLCAGASISSGDVIAQSLFGLR